MIYFDNAATTLKKPPGVLRAVREGLARFGGNPGRSSHRLSLAAAEAVDGVRGAVCRFLGLPNPGHLVFCGNATHALNTVIKGRARHGMHILCSNREHNAVYRPLCRLLSDGVAEFDIYESEGDVRENAARLLRPETGMLLACHVSNVDGHKADLGALAALCRERGIFFAVDASQSAGHIPLSFGGILPDAVCAPGHKGLLGLPGCGILWLREAGSVTPLLEGGSGSDSRRPTMPTDLPEQLEAGTLPVPAILALGAGVAFLSSLPPDEVAAKEAALATQLREGFEGVPGLRLFSGGGVVSLVSEHRSTDEIAEFCDSHGICVRGGLHCAPLAHAAIGTLPGGTVRFSFSYFNTPGEVQHTVRLLRNFLKG